MTSGYKRTQGTYSICTVCSAEFRHKIVCFFRQVRQAIQFMKPILEKRSHGLITIRHILV